MTIGSLIPLSNIVITNILSPVNLSHFFYFFFNFRSQGFWVQYFHLGAVFKNLAFDFPEIGHGYGEAKPAVFFCACLLRRMPDLLGNPCGNIWRKAQANFRCLFAVENAECLPDIFSDLLSRNAGGNFIYAGRDCFDARKNKVPQFIFHGAMRDYVPCAHVVQQVQWHNITG